MIKKKVNHSQTFLQKKKKKRLNIPNQTVYQLKKEKNVIMQTELLKQLYY